MPTSDFLLHKEVILTVQAGIFASIVILAVFAKVSDSKAAARVQRVAHKKCAYDLSIKMAFANWCMRVDL